MKHLILLLFFLINSHFINCQSSELTFFSENGELFYIILDGVRQNNNPSSNIKIDHLDRPNYRVKIIFDDANLEDINRNIFVQDVDNKSVHSVYMIYKNKKNKMDIKMSSFSDVTQKKEPKNEEIIHYHKEEWPLEKPNPRINRISSNTERQDNFDIGINTTGAKVKVNQNGQSTNINIQTPKLDDLMNMNFNDPIQVTNKSAETAKKYNPYETNTISNEVTTNKCNLAMPSADFNAAVATLKKMSFEETTLKTAKQISKKNCMSVQQIISIIKLFSFEESKLDFAIAAYDQCIDTNNYFKINEHFTFSSSSDSLNEFLNSK
jgi:hypothetical protein